MKPRAFLRAVVFLASSLLSATTFAQASELREPRTVAANDRSPALAFRARGELGALGVLAHSIRYGQTTLVDYVEDGDQDTLFFFARLSAELAVRGRHSLILLYQPLSLQTESALRRDLTIGEVNFPARTPTRFGYGFDFYRLSYQYDIYPDARRELAFGAGFQIRNARVSFVSSDGERGFTQTNVGFVPLLRMRGRYVFESAAFLEAELDGWTSPVPGQGRKGEIALGVIADVALRAGVELRRRAELFLTLRYLGGGFRGEGAEDQPLVGPDKWNANWLHTATISVGAGVM